MGEETILVVKWERVSNEKPEGRSEQNMNACCPF